MKTTEVLYFRYATKTKSGDSVRLAFKVDNCVYGIYWGGGVEGWIPSKWYSPEGNYNLNGKKSALDINISEIRKELLK